MKRAHYGKGSRASTLFNFAFHEDNSVLEERPIKCKAFASRHELNFVPHYPLIEDKVSYEPNIFSLIDVVPEN